MSGTQINTGVCTSMVGAHQLATIRVLSACASNPIIRCKNFANVQMQYFRILFIRPDTQLRLTACTSSVL